MWKARSNVKRAVAEVPGRALDFGFGASLHCGLLGELLEHLVAHIDPVLKRVMRLQHLKPL